MVNEDTLITQFINEVEGETASDVDVRTSGGDPDIDPPEIIIEWATARVPGANGHNSIGGYTTNQSGDKIGVEHHMYFQMEFDCTLRYEDELKRDSVLNNLGLAFVPYESDATMFHEDTREWEIDSGRPRGNPVIEPDWYEVGFVARFEYMKRTSDTDNYDTISDVDVETDIDITL